MEESKEEPVSTITVAATSEDGGLNEGIYICKFCPVTYDHLQDTLKHELLMHGVQSVPKRKTFENLLTSAANCLAKGEMRDDIIQISETLHSCKPGSELESIIQMHRYNNDNSEDLYERVLNDLKPELACVGNFEIFPFGSIASGLALKGSDIDLYISRSNRKQYRPPGWKNGLPQIPDKNYDPLKALNRIANVLFHHSKSFSNVVVIRTARVPIIKCVHTETAYKLDINSSCPSSVYNTNYIRSLVDGHPIVRELLFFIKIWAKYVQLIGNGMTSYCLTVMAIFYMQQPLGKFLPMLTSIQSMQMRLQPVMVMGINYAYDKNVFDGPSAAHPKPTTFQLIQGFFKFYNNFDFDTYMISSYLGKAVPLADFNSGKFEFPDYKAQMRDLEEWNGRATEIETDRCMCIQDPFALDRNLSRSIRLNIYEYIRKCFNFGNAICCDASLKTPAQVYEALLCGTVGRMIKSVRDTETEIVKAALNVGNRNADTLSYHMYPCRSDTRALQAIYGKLCNDDENLYLKWVEHYEQIITDIIVSVYLMDMQLQHIDKQPRMANVQSVHMWNLTANLDTWTGRQHFKPKAPQTFMDMQISQTKTFKEQRSGKPESMVKLNCRLMISVFNNRGGLEISLAPADDSPKVITKKCPMRKFFSMLKCSLQNCSLKESLG